MTSFWKLYSNDGLDKNFIVLLFFFLISIRNAGRFNMETYFLYFSSLFTCIYPFLFLLPWVHSIFSIYWLIPRPFSSSSSSSFCICILGGCDRIPMECFASSYSRFSWLYWTRGLPSRVSKVNGFSCLLPD